MHTKIILFTYKWCI